MKGFFLTRSSADRIRQEVRTDGSGRALLCTIPFSAWVLRRNTEAGVPLVYRNDDGVDARTLPWIPCPDQRKRGHVFCPGFFPHFVANRPEYSYQQEVPWHSILPAQVGGAGEFRSRITCRALPVLHAETAWLCGFGAASLQRYALVVTRLTSSDFHHSSSSSILTVTVSMRSSLSSAGNSDS